MAIIDNIIPSQAFEIIRDRIAMILNDEINNQAQLTYSGILLSTIVEVEGNGFDKEDLMAVNVSLAGGPYDNKNSGGSVDGAYSYNIDVYANAKETASVSGSKRAALRMQALLGLCRYILEDPKYRTLGFPTGTYAFIKRVKIERIDIRANSEQDALSTAMGRISFTVEAVEKNTLMAGSLIEGYTTTMNIDNTTKGYFWEEPNEY